MNKKYVQYINPTKEDIDLIQVGDLIRVNDWIKPMRVKGVSKNYFVMMQNQFGKTCYSVCEKKLWDGIRSNLMIGGFFHCGKDDWIFGHIDFDYDFDDEEAVAKYLQSFEDGKTKLSQRSAIPIRELYIKKA